MLLHIFRHLEPFGGQARYEIRKLNQISHPKQRTTLPYDYFGIHSRQVSPLRRNRADSAVINPQQKSLAGPVFTLANAFKRATGERMERMERMDNANKLRRGNGNACIWI